MKLILSTSDLRFTENPTKNGSNIIGGTSPIRRDPKQKSNAELVSSLRGNFAAHSYPENGHPNGDGKPARLCYKSWTHMADDGRKELEIPALNFASSALQEEREQYDLTLKLFYLPGAPTTSRDTQTREALNLVLKELHMPSIDLLIVSFPGIYFDEEEDCPDKLSTRGPIESEPEPLESQIETWKILESLHEQGLVKKLGLAEFGHDRLESFLAGVARVKPSVNQINLRDCCSVPRNLLTLAKTSSIELLVHNDTSNILPRGTVRELLGQGPDGAGVLAEPRRTGSKRKSLHGEESQGGAGVDGLSGEVMPLWVVKYTAVVKNRGVVENKGYFAVAELME